MTKKELLKFMEKTGLMASLPPETNPERIVDAIRNADENALGEIEKTIKGLFEKQKLFQEQMRELQKQIDALLKKAKKLTAQYAEAKEEIREDKQLEQLLKEL